MNQCKFYCITFKNPERRRKMEERFRNIGIEVEFQEGAEFTDERIVNTGADKERRTLSCTYGHLDAITRFASQSEKEYGVFCEDDVHIHKNFANELPSIISTVKSLDLDVLLLGYLTPYPIEPWNNNFRLLTQMGERRYHSYPDDQWGGQMYMLTLAQAKYFVAKYRDTDYVKRSIQDKSMTPFSPDWTFTKNAFKRALVYPMFGVEEGVISSTDPGYVAFHRNCHLCNYNPDKFF